MVDKIKQQAGEKRWIGVEKSEKKALASKAAHARWKAKGVLVAEFQGVIEIGGVQLQCAVLSDKSRVLSERSVCDAIGHKRHPDDYERKRTDAAAGIVPLPSFAADVIRQFLPESTIEKLAKPIRYQIVEGFGIPAVGVDATVLADLCEAYLAARDAGVLTEKDQPKAAAAMRLMRALARVAIVALIDEATGYQVVRDRDELQKLLEKYVSEELRPWTKIFPDDFYTNLFRLRGLTTADVRKRPAYFGHLTNDIVYNRLIPGILPKLNDINPKNESGNRLYRHTQYLTKEIGEVHLRNHLVSVVALMKASTTYKEFKTLLDRAAPVQGLESEGEQNESSQC